MKRRSSGSPDDEQDDFPFRPTSGPRSAEKLDLTPMHAKVVEQLLRRRKCKEIAAEMGIGECTVRTYLGRIYDRNHVADQTNSSSASWRYRRRGR
ncbi:MAG: hypothetical protein U1D30_22795 [Planctomycetota bacterium]